MTDRQRQAPAKKIAGNVYLFPVRKQPVTDPNRVQKSVRAAKTVIRAFPVVPTPTLGENKRTYVRSLSGQPSSSQTRWLKRGLERDGGKLPLFDEEGQKISRCTVVTCLDRGWAEPAFANPAKPELMLCRLTERGRAVID